MLVELGPVTATDVQGWTRFARRLVAELRTNPDDLEGVVCDDFLDEWSALIDEWAEVAGRAETFRWSKTFDTEVGDFLLYGFVRCYRSPGLASHVTEAEFDAHRPFTNHVINAFIDGLVDEGQGYAHFAEGIRASLGDSLD